MPAINPHWHVCLRLPTPVYNGRLNNTHPQSSVRVNWASHSWWHFFLPQKCLRQKMRPKQHEKLQVRKLYLLVVCGSADRANEDIPVEGRRIFWAINQSRDKSTRCTSGLSHHHMALTQIKPSLIQKSPL